jgi:hypothetical protein
MHTTPQMNAPNIDYDAAAPHAVTRKFHDVTKTQLDGNGHLQRLSSGCCVASGGDSAKPLADCAKLWSRPSTAFPLLSDSGHMSILAPL